MTDIADAVAQVLKDGGPPVLLLDTCILLDLLQRLAQDEGYQFDPVVRLVSKLSAVPVPVRIILPHLVPVEWQQNLSGRRDKLRQYLEAQQKRHERIDAACRATGLSLPAPGYGALSLPQALADLAQQIIDTSLQLSRDQGCVDRSLQRVIGKERPGHEGKIKDALIFEECLEVARQLRAAPYGGRVIFVSSNHTDFGLGKNQNRWHGELEAQCQQCGLEFFSSLPVALLNLGI
jgi:hypothetical protein